MTDRRTALGRVLLLLAAPAFLSLAGCKIVSIKADQEARERRSENLDPTAYVAGIWSSRVLPHVETSATPLPELLQAIAVNLDQAGAAHGRKVGDSAPWTFVARGAGKVTGVDRKSRSGSIEIAVDGSDRPVVVQTGPVIVDTAIRDSLPFLTFNDFADQIAFAGVGSALTRRALAEAKPTLQSLAVGDRIQVLGVFNLATADAPIRLTPVRVERQPQARS